jgi:hypothetical protein
VHTPAHLQQEKPYTKFLIYSVSVNLKLEHNHVVDDHNIFIGQIKTGFHHSQ